MSTAEIESLAKELAVLTRGQAVFYPLRDVDVVSIAEILGDLKVRSIEFLRPVGRVTLDSVSSQVDTRGLHFAGTFAELVEKSREPFPKAKTSDPVVVDIPGDIKLRALRAIGYPLNLCVVGTCIWLPAELGYPLNWHWLPTRGLHFRGTC